MAFIKENDVDYISQLGFLIENEADLKGDCKMEAQMKVSTGYENGKSPLFEKVRTHAELIAALTSGVLILFGWLSEKLEHPALSVAFFLLAYVIGGYAKTKEGITDTIKNKTLNVEILMLLAAIGAAIIGYWMEGAILIFIFSLSGALETYTMNKSRKEISALMELQPEVALRVTDGNETVVPVSELVIGDHILVKPGERVPSDGKILKGRTTLDEAAITGESIPVSKKPGDEVFAGTVNLNGSITVEITKKSSETLFQKIIQLVQTAQSEKSPSQLFIEKFEGTYVKVVLLVVGLMMFLPHFLLGWSWTETFYRAMILLVVASPCALVASIMPATLSAISNGARRGILFKGGVHLEKLQHIKAIAFDKTGTLTKGKPEVTNFIAGEGEPEEEILLKAASLEHHSNHPLAQAIVAYAKNRLNAGFIEPDHFEDIPGWGIKGQFGDEKWKIGKEQFMEQTAENTFAKQAAEQFAKEGKTTVFVEIDGRIAAVIALKDVVRSETQAAINELNAKGIHTVMLTGDSKTTAETIARESRVKEYIAECLPANKVDEVKKLKERFGLVAMVGDGINDAPALATANVGIAMGEGTDVALETADVVLMKNDLSRIYEAIKLSERMNRIIKQNIVFSIGVIILLICSNFLQILDLPLGVIGHEGSTILVILNGLRLLR